MTRKVSRRTLIHDGLAVTAFIPALAWLRCAAAAQSDLPPLDPKEPTAVTLGFVNDASQVDGAKNPTYAPGQTCANCQQYQGDRSDARGKGSCVLFAGKSVPAAGWCKVWRKNY